MIIPGSNGGLEPLRLYTARDVANYLGLTDHKGVYTIPESELPQSRVGPRRGAVRYFGIQVMRYAQNLPPADLSQLDLFELPRTPGKTRLI
jgi:hypothetical protein